MENYNSALEWRYATKAFDAEKRVSDDDFAEILKSVQLSASSYGLQPYKILVIKNQELKKKLKPVSYNQGQIEDASHIVIFCAYHELTDLDVDAYIDNISATREVPTESLEGYSNMMKSSVGNFSDEKQVEWASKQIYIALGNLLSSCAVLQVDSCPIEGFLPQKYSDILGLEQKGLIPVVVAAVGYRSESDQSQHAAKVRKPSEVLFETIN